MYFSQFSTHCWFSPEKKKILRTLGLKNKNSVNPYSVLKLKLIMYTWNLDLKKPVVFLGTLFNTRTMLLIQEQNLYKYMHRIVFRLKLHGWRVSIVHFVKDGARLFPWHSGWLLLSFQSQVSHSGQYILRTLTLLVRAELKTWQAGQYDWLQNQGFLLFQATS